MAESRPLVCVGSQHVEENFVEKLRTVLLSPVEDLTLQKGADSVRRECKSKLLLPAPSRVASPGLTRWGTRMGHLGLLSAWAHALVAVLIFSGRLHASKTSPLCSTRSVS